MTDSIPNGSDRTFARIRGWLIVVLLLGNFLPGCATHLCLSDFDEYYPAYGGRRPRADMLHGRVGSIFDPAPELDAEHYLPQEQGQWSNRTNYPWNYSPNQPAVFQESHQPIGPELISPTSGQIHASVGPSDWID